MRKDRKSRLIIGLMLINLSIILGNKGLLGDSSRGLIIGIGIGFLLLSIFGKGKSKDQSSGKK